MMCEFCIQHGAGKKWFLESKNYAEKLASSGGRDEFIEDFFRNYEKNYKIKTKEMDIAGKLPFIRGHAEVKLNNYFSQKHAGQVISLEDATAICSIPGRVSVIDCPCRKYLFGKGAKKCILFGTTADIVENIPEFSGLSDMGCEEAAELLESVETNGDVHTVWTFLTPYIGAICNCDKQGCLLFHLKNQYKSSKIVFKGHEIARVNQNSCNGCGKCKEVCQFGGIVINRKAKINSNCHGCGVCRRFCPEESIDLVPRWNFRDRLTL